VRSYFKEVDNPTDEELERWARDPNAMQPHEDWDIIIATIEKVPIFLQLIADPECKHKRVFVECLRAVVRLYDLERDQKAAVEFIKALRKSQDNELKLIADNFEEKIIRLEIVMKPLREHDQRKIRRS
jgi:hypothetical protein